MAKEIKNLAASVSERLRNYAKEQGEEFQSVLVRYGAERFLYRLSQSTHNERFLLKGASLFTLWFDQPHRPTKDLDLLGFAPNEIPAIEQAIKEICSIEYADGLNFLAETVVGETIREDLAYQGVRVKLTANLGNIRIPLQIDVGIGDAVTPGPETAEFPGLLDFPHAKLRVYPKETVVAEKFEAMVRLGMANGRMKDFWDLRYMIDEFDFDGNLLQTAIRATFQRRLTSFPERLPVALSDEFAKDANVSDRWNGFIRRNRLDRFTDLVRIVERLRSFFEPLIEAESGDNQFNMKWKAGADWI